MNECPLRQFGRILGAAVKSVDVKFLDVFGFPPAFPFHVSFDIAVPASTAALLHAAETPIAIFGLWLLAATTIKRLRSQHKRLVDRYFADRPSVVPQHRRQV